VTFPDMDSAARENTSSRNNINAAVVFMVKSSYGKYNQCDNIVPERKSFNLQACRTYVLCSAYSQTKSQKHKGVLVFNWKKQYLCVSADEFPPLDIHIFLFIA
jgi:hypothetical protein